MQRRRAVNLNCKCFYLFSRVYVAVFACVSFAIRLSFACGEGALATTAAAAAAAVSCSFSLIISVLSVVVMFACVACFV